MGPPVAAEEQQDRQGDGDDDALQHAEEDDADARDQGDDDGAAAHPRRPAQHPRSISESAATMTTAASAVCGRSASSQLRNSSSRSDEAGADEAGELAAGAGLLGDGGARAAGGDGEALEEPGGDVGRADADHLLVGVDLVAAAGREARRRGDRVGQGDERDAQRGDEQRHHVAEAGPGEGRRRDALGQRADRGDALRGEVERGGDAVAPTTATSTGGHPGGEPRQDEQHDEHGDADEQRGGVGLVQALDELLDLVEEAVGVGREAEELRQLADDDRDAQAVHVADLHLLGEQVGDEAELAQPRGRSRRARRAREHPGERDRGAGIAAGTSSGVIAAKISGEIDESGPSTSTREGPNSA